ncbi:MAG: DEAD/DEAH box helicase family protein [Chloroflexi bacterium]|nr:DEAD/DEAH box helicase family protein [Chloroflexota bacterium]
MTAVLGMKPPAKLEERDNFRERLIARSDSRVMVLNDEAHHTHDPQSTWNQTIRDLHDAHDHDLAAQLDFSATPRYDSGALFGWTISDYTLKQAIVDRIVKRPVEGSPTPVKRRATWRACAMNRSSWRASSAGANTVSS